MKILKACLDQELLWVIDEAIGGLYFIDQRNFEMNCVIDCWELFPHGTFGVQSLIRWKEDYIVIIPSEIDKNWILYNKITKKIEYRKIIEQKYKGRLIAIDQERNQLYFFPISIHGPVLIVDLDTLKCSQIIENWNNKLLDNCPETAWTGAYNGQYIFYPQKNTRILVRLECETRKIDLIELIISENVIDVNYAFGELWVLPISGNNIYQIDENGLIVNTVKLTMRDAVDSIPDFARIVVQKEYLFLLPCYRKGIYIYDKLRGKTHIVLNENLILEEDREFYLRYWEYCIKDNRICFLPFRNKYIEIDLNTLAYKEKELLYPIVWSDEEKIRRYIWSHVSEYDFIIREVDRCDLGIFLRYIQCKTKAENYSKTESIGNRVWEKFIKNFQNVK